MSFRLNRLAEEIKREVTDILQTQLKDPRVSKFASITGVELSKDLRHAKIYVSVLGSEEDQNKTLDGLTSATGFIRSKIGNRIRLRYIPEIIFHLDPSIQKGIKITQLLYTVKEKEGVGDL